MLFKGHEVADGGRLRDRGPQDDITGLAYHPGVGEGAPSGGVEPFPVVAQQVQQAHPGLQGVDEAAVDYPDTFAVVGVGVGDEAHKVSGGLLGSEGTAQGAAVVGHGVSEGGQDVELTAVLVAVGAVQVEDDAFAVGPAGELAEIAVTGRLERRQPAGPGVACGALDGAVVAVVGVQDGADPVPGDERAVAAGPVPGVIEVTRLLAS